jgi:hypothetical protein
MKPAVTKYRNDVRVPPAFEELKNSPDFILDIFFGYHSKRKYNLPGESLCIREQVARTLTSRLRLSKIYPTKVSQIALQGTLWTCPELPASIRFTWDKWGKLPVVQEKSSMMLRSSDEFEKRSDQVYK